MEEGLILFFGAIVAFILHVAFWFCVVYGALWSLSHFGVI